MSFCPYGGSEVPAADDVGAVDGVGTAPAPGWTPPGEPGAVQTAVVGSPHPVRPAATAATPSPSTPRRRMTHSAVPRTAHARAVNAIDPSSAYGSRVRRLSRRAARCSSVKDIV